MIESTTFKPGVSRRYSERAGLSIQRRGRYSRMFASAVYRFVHRTEGTTSVEYAVMLAMILAAVIGAIGAVGGQTSGLWSSIQGQLNNAGVGS